MASKVIYTSTIHVPVYTAWKCQKCNNVNTNEGTILCVGATASYSFKQSKLDAAKEEAMEMVQSEWKDKAMKIITDPSAHPEEVRSGLILGKIKCKNCGKKPRWNSKGRIADVFIIAGLILGLLSGWIAISVRNNIVCWAVFSVCVAAIILSIRSDNVFKKYMRKLPGQFVPVIGTQNEELLVYAREIWKKEIPTLEECIALADGSSADVQSGNNQNLTSSSDNIITKPETEGKKSEEDGSKIEYEEDSSTQRNDLEIIDHSTARSITSELERLSKLYHDGSLTESEFSEAKKRLISKL